MKRMTQKAKQQDQHWKMLMISAQSGDADAYDELLSAVAPFIRSIVLRTVGNVDWVDDAVQETLITLHRARHTFDHSRPFSPWLTAIASRRAIDLLRKLSRVARHEVADEIHLVTFADQRTNNNEEAGDAGKQLADLLQHLPPGQRQAIEMVKWREMSLKEASAASGISVSALKVAIHRGMRKLNKRFKETRNS